MGSSRENKKHSFVHIYCGDGKGKTTTAMGLTIRAAGSGKRVLLFQFLKDNKTSELNVLKNIPNIDIVEGPDRIKFSFQMTEQEKAELLEKNDADFIKLTEKAAAYDVLVMDEIVYAIAAGLMSEPLVIRFLENRPANLEVIMTGQNPTPELIDHADYVSEIRKIKHPFDEGVPSRKGIEF